MEPAHRIHKALLSVFDKNGLESLARTLHEKGVALYSTGGTAKFLEDLKIPVIKIESITQFPEMMDGRVKTLHPRVFGGILARRDQAEDLAAAMQHGIPLFDLVVVNLYPFGEHLSGSVKEQTKYIDIGGPSMLRAAAKNFESVVVLSDSADYPAFIETFQQTGGTTHAFRHMLSARTFARTSRYDAMIASTWSAKSELPNMLSLTNQRPLRYGENPHQAAVWSGPEPMPWKILQGKELSYNNLLDAEAALRLVNDFSTPALAIIKHNNPCGVASSENGTTLSLFENALSCDSKSAFGGIVAVNDTVDGKAADAMAKIFLEVVIAPEFTKEALDIFATKKNLRLIEWEKPQTTQVEVRPALGGWLVQETDNRATPTEYKTVTTTQVPDNCWQDLWLAWISCKHVRSNAIVIANNGNTVGIGAGQMSRVDAVGIALEKAQANGKLQGAVLASDAFFPFRDNIDLLKGKGIRAIVQPGGSQRDEEVIAACNEHGIAMVFTGERHFRH